jgi:glycosyltransferase involved in cell wall biosynthesis
MIRSICFILNFAPHYRSSLFKKLDQNVCCDFYFGDSPPSIITSFEYTNLCGFKKTLKNYYIKKRLYWQFGALKVAFMPYKKFILTGDPHTLSTWLVLIICKFRNKKTYLWTHGLYGREGKIKKWFKKLFYNLASHIFLYNNYSKVLMINEGFNPKDLTVVFNSIDDEVAYFQRIKVLNCNTSTQYFENDHPVLITIGRIRNDKHIKLLLEALNILNNQHNMVSL